jgi:hypothetical protein
LLPFTSHAIRKHPRDRGVGAGVARDFMTKRNSELVDIRDGAPTTPSVPRLATSATLAKCGPTPAFVFARVFAADGSERRVANGIDLFANSEISRVWASVDVAPGG